MSDKALFLMHSFTPLQGLIWRIPSVHLPFDKMSNKALKSVTRSDLATTVCTSTV